MELIRTKIVRAAKDHECISCLKKVNGGKSCRSTTLSYDSGIISLYSCMACETRFDLNMTENTRRFLFRIKGVIVRTMSNLIKGIK